MATLDSLYAEKNQYENLKENVIALINQLSTIENDLLPLNIIEAFKIDEDFPESGFINLQKDKLRSNKEELKFTIIPAIDNEINQLNAEIEAEQRRLEEERRAREEAERRARENASSNN